MSGKSIVRSGAVFVMVMTAATRAQVITNVERRNPDAVSSAAVVQLAPGPLGDGVQAYADRTHLFLNVPASLVGAEYVLMSNDDKANPFHELHLTIARAGTLYLFIDNRVGTHVGDEAGSPDLQAAGMAWVAEMGFVNTGLKMAVGEGADGTINNYYTVFAKPVSAGVIVLKAQNDVYVGGPYDRNMYGVAAMANGKATNPVPGDGGRQVDAAPLLQWTPGLGAVCHNVYLGTTPQLGPAELVESNLRTPSCQLTEVLAPGVTHYWRVDEVGADIVTGDVWSFTTEADEIAPLDMVGWWKLDDGGSDRACDSSGRGQHGNLWGDPQWVQGYVRGALQMDGQDDFVDTHYAEDLAQWTVCVWVKSPAAPKADPESGPVHRQANYQLDWNHPDDRFRGAAALRIGDTWYPAGFGPLSADTWYHLAATFDGTALRAYRDGVLVTTNPAAQGVPFPEANTLTLGRHACAEQFFTGIIDDVRLYRRALTREEIGEIVRAATPVPFQAWNPVPADGGRQVDAAPLLQWTPGLGAVSHNVYLSTNQRLGPGQLIASNLQTPSYQLTEGLAAGVTYFWRVDEVGAEIVKGDTWSFTTEVEKVADAGLVGWWKLDDEGVAVALDSSTGGHDGILYGNPSWAPGHVGGALRLDGIDDYVDTFYYENLPVWTVSAWVVSPRAPQRGDLGGPVHREANYQFNWDHSDSPFQGTVALQIGANWYPASFGPLFANQWYHLAATFDGSSLKAYTNGCLITTNTEARGVPSYEPASLKIGRHAVTMSYFEGAVDEVRVYQRALTPEEIEYLTYYTSGEARDPQPAPGGDVAIRDVNALRWSAGQGAVMHDVYFGTDATAVGTADVNSPVYRGRQADANFPLLGLVASDGTCFWRIDEVEADGVTIHKGPVWDFIVFSHPVIDNFEHYTDEEGHRIGETWTDGSRNGTGAQVIRWPPGAEPGPWMPSALGTRSMYLGYDNTRAPFSSEARRQFAPEKDWTADGVDTLCLWLRGDVVSFSETAPGAFTMSGTGADIWADGDQFRYAYQRLDGDGAITVRVESLGPTDFWAKAGVMIRASLDPLSAHAFMLVTPDGLRVFQNRPANYDMRGYSAHTWGMPSMPTWLKLEREGDQFTGYHSVDGVNWIRQSPTDNTGPDPSPNPQTIPMPPCVYVGLAVTSHATVATTATFSGVEIIGDVIDPWQVTAVGVDQPGNSPYDLYVRIEDSNEESATVVHPDPAAVNITDWTEWRIPLSSFSGVDLSRVKGMAIGVGGGASTIVPGTGTGHIYLDNIGLLKSEPNEVADR